MIARTSAGRYDTEKERTMFELTPEQARAMAEQKAPLKVLNPLTQEMYVLIRQNVYELSCGLVQPFNRGVEDDPDMDVYEQYRKKS
jgi:hypothetical protein